MSRMTWFPFYVEDFRVSTLELKTDEIGVYFTMLVLCYARGGPLPGNDAELKFMLQRQIADFHGHTYNRIVKKLLAKYFYRDDEGNWRQKRVELELERAKEFTDKQRERVTKRWVSDTEKDDKRSANAPQTSRKRSANVSQNDERSLKDKDFHSTNNNTIHNNISTNVDITREPTALAILSECMSEQTARDLIAHRQKLRKPLTARAAKLLAKDFVAYGNPEEAAEMMIKNGWQGFHPTWVTNQTRAGPAANGKGGMASLLAKSLGLKNGRESRDTDEAVHVLPVYDRAERGNVSDDGRQLSGDIIDLLAVDTRRGM